MGLFSFGNKDVAPTRRSRTTSSAQRSSDRERRSERRPEQEGMLDPMLPEKQRARRRLIGAIALVLAAVIALPMVLDSHPKPVTGDIAIQIPNSDTAAKSASAKSHAVPRAAATDTDAGPGADDQGPAAAAPGNSKTAHAGTGSVPTLPVPPAVATAPARTPPLNTRAIPDEGDVPPASAAGSRFIVQIGSFPSESRARVWVNKLKANGVPAYLEHRAQPDGTDRVLLRAGPFADRAAAQSAVKKVREAGLSATSPKDTPGAGSNTAKAPARATP